MVQIDRALNLILPIEREGSTLWVHSTPVSRQVFDAHFMDLAKAFTTIFKGGLGEVGGPRVAALVLRRIADAAGSRDDVERSFFAEMRRLTNVVLPGSAGWETLPYHEAVAKNLLDEEDRAEVENALTFFTLVSVMLRRNQRRGMLEASMVALWDGQITALNSTEYAASLPTLTATAPSGARAA